MCDWYADCKSNADLTVSGLYGSAVPFCNQASNKEAESQVMSRLALADRDHRVEQLGAHFFGQWRTWVLDYVGNGIIIQRYRYLDDVPVNRETDGVVDEFVDHLNEKLRGAFGSRLVACIFKAKFTFGPGICIGTHRLLEHVARNETLGFDVFD